MLARAVVKPVSPAIAKKRRKDKVIRIAVP
jgi:hypothetical protein